MRAVYIAALAAIASGTVCWLIDQWMLRCRTPFRATVATALIVVSTWVAVLVRTASWLKIPGAYGPVQYWGSADGAMDFIMGPRVLAMFLVFYAALPLAILTLIVTPISWFIPSEHDPGRRTAIPILALSMFGLAFYWFVHYEFFPSV